MLATSQAISAPRLGEESEWLKEKGDEWRVDVAVLARGVEVLVIHHGLGGPVEVDEVAMVVAVAGEEECAGGEGGEEEIEGGEGEGGELPGEVDPGLFLRKRRVH